MFGIFSIIMGMIKIGDRVNSLELIRLISTKNTQYIFLTKNLITNEHVTIKLLENPTLDEQNRLKHEAEILNKISHPNIIKIINFTLI